MKSASVMSKTKVLFLKFTVVPKSIVKRIERVTVAGIAVGTTTTTDPISNSARRSDARRVTRRTKVLMQEMRNAYGRDVYRDPILFHDAKYCRTRMVIEVGAEAIDE